jgi:hypothetical protein
MIDDATSRSEGRFVQHDGTRENMDVLKTRPCPVQLGQAER